LLIGVADISGIIYRDRHYRTTSGAANGSEGLGRREMKCLIITLSGPLAEAITVERATYLNDQGYAVTAQYGKVLVQKEKVTG
jgi:hypothetical protein